MSSIQRFPRPWAYVFRSGSTASPLVALDELPSYISVGRLPPVVPAEYVHRLALPFVGQHPAAELKFDVLHNGRVLAEVSENKSASPSSPSDDDMYPSRSAPTPLHGCGDDLPPSSVVRLDDAGPGSLPSGVRDHEEAPPGSTDDPARDHVSDNGKRGCEAVNGADRRRKELASPPDYGTRVIRRSHPSGGHPQPGLKRFCTHWLRTGECDYMQQGCVFKHIMPHDIEVLHECGLGDFPVWWRVLVHARDEAVVGWYAEHRRFLAEAGVDPDRDFGGRDGIGAPTSRLKPIGKAHSHGRQRQKASRQSTQQQVATRRPQPSSRTIESAVNTHRRASGEPASGSAAAAVFGRTASALSSSRHAPIPAPTLSASSPAGKMASESRTAPAGRGRRSLNAASPVHRRVHTHVPLGSVHTITSSGDGSEARFSVTSASALSPSASTAGTAEAASELAVGDSGSVHTTANPQDRAAASSASPSIPVEKPPKSSGRAKGNGAKASTPRPKPSPAGQGQAHTHHPASTSGSSTGQLARAEKDDGGGGTDHYGGGGGRWRSSRRRGKAAGSDDDGRSKPQDASSIQSQIDALSPEARARIIANALAADDKRG